MEMVGIPLRVYLTLAAMKRNMYSTTLCMHVTINSSKEEIKAGTQVIFYPYTCICTNIMSVHYSLQDLLRLLILNETTATVHDRQVSNV